MLLEFLYQLRALKVPVGLQEWMALMEALGHGLHESSLTGFYHLARSILVHSEAHFPRAGLGRLDLAQAEHLRLAPALAQDRAQSSPPPARR